MLRRLRKTSGDIDIGFNGMPENWRGLDKLQLWTLVSLPIHFAAFVLIQCHTARFLTRSLPVEDAIIFTIYISVAILNVLCNVSIDHCTFLLHGIRLALELALSIGGASDVDVNSRISDIPSKVASIIGSLDVEPDSIGYVCCPKCFACYPMETYPTKCSNQEAPDAPVCDRTLRQYTDSTKKRSYAARRYMYHDINQWMARLLCRPGMEEHLDRDVFQNEAAPGEKRDIWDGLILPNFKFKDGERFVSKQPAGEARYVFGLNMDGFNPFGNKQAGSKGSCGAMYMVCLNLPPHLRYRVENIFLVGVIPGPHHPSLVQINHLLRPLVDDLLRFWDPGVYYSRTCRYTSGRLVRCALVPVICDLPAARQLMAFASHSSNHFCCYCGLEKSDLDNLDISTWPPGIKTREEYIALAEQWRDASLAQRVKLFEKHGVRYSELLRLPYWDPVKFVVIDSMHALLLTNIKHHCRRLWGMDIKADDSENQGDKRKRKKGPPTPEEMEVAFDVLRRGTCEDLRKLKLGVLSQLCLEVSLPTGGKKNKLIDQLDQ